MALPIAPISGINQNLFPYKVNSDFFKEWVKVTPLSNLMGSEMTRPIYRHKLRDGEGLQFRVGRLEAFDYKNPVVGLDQRRGAAQQPKVNSDSIDVSFKSFPIQLSGLDIVKLGTPIKLPDQVRPQLIEACARNLNYDLFNAMIKDLYPNPATSKPSYDRIALAGAGNDGLADINRATYNALAGIVAALGSAGGLSGAATPAASGLSGRHILALKRMAESGGRSLGFEHAVRPAYLKTKSGWPMNEYIYLIDPESFTSLLSDPLFTSTTMARGTTVESDQPQAIHGADYIGRFFGVHIYVVNDLLDYRVTYRPNAAGADVEAAWNIFMGAGALSVGWNEFPFVVMDMDEVERIQLFVSHEQRGQKALTFASKQGIVPVVEQGIIHSFSRLY